MSLSSSESSSVPTVLDPFRDTVDKYRLAGFFGPLPLPYKEKHPPPIDYTGEQAQYPTTEVIENWKNGKNAKGDKPLGGKRHNICIRLAGVNDEYEIIGIDVDDYWKGDKKKEGYSQLQELESQLGELPPTWISSARTDGKSGIRYFLVPRKHAFRGQADKDIEVIRKGHRFAVVWPSVHPDGGTYWWFPPGVRPTKGGRDEWNNVLPDARQLPRLPEKWFDYLTNGKTLASDDGHIDVDSSVQQIYDWASDTFHGDDDYVPCTKMREKLELHKKAIEDEATSHDKLTNAHWNILRLAAEGHLGWNMAINELESHFSATTIARGKREVVEVNGEIFRSRIQALRKVKGQIDERLKIGAAAVDAPCVKLGICGPGVQPGSDGSANAKTADNGSMVTLGSANPDSGNGSGVSGGIVGGGAGLKGVPDYECNDDGNARHFLDMFTVLDQGALVRWSEGYGWLVWHSEEHYWERDELGDQIVRRMWQKVKERQIAYAEACFGDYLRMQDEFIKGVNGTTQEDVKLAKTLAIKWKNFSESSGNNRTAENALKAAHSLQGVSVSINDLDQSPYLLGVKNGVVELDRENVRLREAQPSDLITRNTHCTWEKPSSHATTIWQDYLDTFLPNPELQRTAQIALGHTLIGGNPEKIMIVLKGDPNTGKSTMVSSMLNALGDYAIPVSQTIFQNHKLNPMLARAITSRVIVCSEFDESDKLSASQVKRLTGGSDKITAEMKGSNVLIEGVPQFVPILATNEVPTISGADKALQNRLYVIPFNVTPSTINKKQSAIIESVCKTAILGWLIEGYQQYCVLNEIPVSKEIREETAAFVAQLDEVATFADECVASVRQGEGEGYVKPTDMYSRFERWWIENSYQPRDKPSQHKFSRRLKALGFQQMLKRHDGEVSRFWVGVKFKNQSSNVLQLKRVTDMTVTPKT